MHEPLEEQETHRRVQPAPQCLQTMPIPVHSTAAMLCQSLDSWLAKYQSPVRPPMLNARADIDQNTEQVSDTARTQPERRQRGQPTNTCLATTEIVTTIPARPSTARLQDWKAEK
jgi:hypothetical protein